ncbi:MAG TPA: 30S ribosomal protein S20 [Thermoanaerobaculia bacterium]|jgi:small subunit ribosomal protein S20|nr:30S ribosomal protein S20 [Thermoanaerobaculia bacterium]
MANTRSAEKQQRQAAKATVRNRAGKSRLKSALKKARTSVSEGNVDSGVVSTGFSEIDKAAKKGIIKTNTADRYKARLAAAAKRTAAK